MSQQTAAERFKKWRQDKNVSAYRIAKQIGVHPSFISNIEANRRPMSKEFMQKVAALPELGLSYSTLRAWRILEEFNTDEITQAFQFMKEGSVGLEKAAV